VSKVCDCRSISGRSTDWVNKTYAQRDTLPIAGIYAEVKTTWAGGPAAFSRGYLRLLLRESDNNLGWKLH
jgi:hypothetical protein